MEYSLDMLIRLYMASMGGRTVRTREGVFPLRVAPLSPLLPYIAWRIRICSRILTGTDGVILTAIASRSMLNVISKGPVDIVCCRSVLSALVWVLGEPSGEEFDLRPASDEISNLLGTFSGELPVQAAINQMLIHNHHTSLESLNKQRNRTIVRPQAPQQEVVQ